ncbi:MAG: PBP1A family penicillin-binding protein [Elusimicrobiota bacterium]
MTRPRFYSAALLLAALIVGSGWGLRKFLATLPSYSRLEAYTPSLTTRVYDTHGEEIAALSIERRALLTLAEIPVDLQNAVMATEDSQFFKHWGVSPRGILRAAIRNFRAGRFVQGGSTLTQQLAKLIFLTPERKLIRKVKEAVLAVQMERNFSKDEILQLYLNQIYFGHGAYGVQSAAHIYFGKDIKELTLPECALLAGMIRYPGGYSPFKYPKRAATRRKFVLHRMLEEGFITKAELDPALEVPIPVARPEMAGIKTPYFVEYIRRFLEPKYGYDKFWRGGLRINTTLDMRLQAIAEKTIEEELGKFDEDARKNWEAQLAEDVEAGIEPPSVSTSPPSKVQAVFLLLDVKTGAVRVMVGGRGDQFNRSVQAQRQPGSTFKPFVFATALNGTMTGMTLVEDGPLAYYYDGRDWRLLEGATDQFAITLATAPFAGSEDFKVWVPNNYDNKFLGVITLRKALAVSRNMTSVRLIEHIGPPRVVELAHRAGIRSYLSPVLSLGLGSSVVSPLELANAFQTFANGGIQVSPYSVTRVQDIRGRILQHHVPREKEAMTPQTAYLITHLLKAVITGGTGRHARVLKRPLAGKTGTTNDSKDLWFVGYTPDLIAVSWMGYDDSTPLGKKISSSATIVPWWTKIMKQVLEDYPSRDFPVPDGIVFHKVDTQTGYLALPTCPRQALQAFREGTEPAEYCPHDHAQPIVLKASFDVRGDMQEAFAEDESEFIAEPVGDEDDDGTAQQQKRQLYEEGLPQLPSDEELETLSDMDF